MACMLSLIVLALVGAGIAALSLFRATDDAAHDIAEEPEFPCGGCGEFFEGDTCPMCGSQR